MLTLTTTFATTKRPFGVFPEFNERKFAQAWHYLTADRKPLGYAVRYEGEDGSKDVVPYFKDGKKAGQVAPGALPIRSLFGLSSAAAAHAHTVFVVEGEKTATALHAIGLPCISWLGGSNAVAKTNWLAVAKLAQQFTVIPDYDEPGRHAAADVVDALVAAGVDAEHVSVVDGLLDGQPEKAGSDAWDWLNAQHNEWDGVYGLATEVCEPLVESFRASVRKLVKPLPESWRKHADTSAGFVSSGHQLTEAERSAISRGGYEALGYVGTTNHVWSNATQSVEAVTPAHLKKPDLMALCGPAWIHAIYDTVDDKGGRRTNYDQCAEDLVAACQEKGLYSPGRVRGAGVWADGNSLVVNSRELWRTDGAAISRTGGEYVYAAVRDIGLSAATPIASNEDMAELSDALTTWAWDRPTDRMLMLGWLASAVMPGALNRRPHIILTGRKGSGKTTLQNLVYDVLGTCVLKADGDSTVAGITQAIGASAMAVLIDEAEGDSVRTTKLISMLRSSYSSDADSLRGTSDQTGRSFALKMSGLLSMIQPPTLEPADKTRILTLDLQALSQDKCMNPSRLVIDSEHARDLGKRFRALVLSRYSVFTKSLAVVRSVLLRSGDAARAADTIGTLLAWSYAIKSEHAVSPEVATEIIKRMDLATHREAQQSSDEGDALERLLDSVHDGETVAGLIVQALKDRRSVYLERLGLRVVNEKTGHIFLAVASSADHPGLRALFKGSRWEMGGWGVILSRAPGALRKKVQIDSRVRDAVLVPVPKDLLVAAGRHVAPVAAQTELDVAVA